MLEELARLYCVCSYAISVRLQAAGEDMCTILFFDDEAASETCGERVRECPACHQQLGIHTLMARI
jgi:hypothetical protein